MKNKPLFLSLIGLSLIAFFACQNPTVPAGGTGTLKISFQTGRGIAVNFNILITSYTVTLHCSSNPAQTDLTSPQISPVLGGDYFNFNAVPAGTWDIHVSALDNSSQTVAQGSVTGVTLVAGASLNVPVTISGNQTPGGKGNFSFTFEFPPASADTVVWQLINAGGTGTATGTISTFTIDSGTSFNKATISQAGLSSGFYTLQLSFFRGGSSGVSAGVYGEAVNIWDGVTSDQWLDSNGAFQPMRVFAASDFSSTNISLANLTATVLGSTVPYPLGFSSASTIYTYNVLSTQSVQFTPVGSLAGQTIQYQIGSNEGQWINITSGTTTPAVTPGNVIYFQVTANDGIEMRQYSVAVGTTAVLGWTPPLPPPNNTVTISGPSTLVYTYPATFTAVVTGGGGSNKWYLDGLIPGVVSSSYSITPTISSLAWGSHILTVTNKGNLGIAFSGSFTFNMANPANVVTFAGSGNQAELDATGTSANFNSPAGICSDGTNLYVTDWYGRDVRKIVIASKVVTTLSGTPGIAGHNDDNASDGGATARFSLPTGICTDGTYVYVSDGIEGGGYSTIRKISIANGNTTTLAGSFTDLTGFSKDSTDGTGGTARFYGSGEMCLSGSTIYVSDFQGNTIRMVNTLTGNTTTLAGLSNTSGNVDGVDGGASRFNQPRGLCFDSSGNYLYVADGGNNEIRKVNISTGQTITLAGNLTPGYKDALGTLASFNYPLGVSSDGNSLFISEINNPVVRRMSLTAPFLVTTIAGTQTQGAQDGYGSGSGFKSLRGNIYLGSYLYVVDFGGNTIRQLTF